MAETNTSSSKRSSGPGLGDKLRNLAAKSGVSGGLGFHRFSQDFRSPVNPQIGGAKVKRKVKTSPNSVLDEPEENSDEEDGAQLLDFAEQLRKFLPLALSNLKDFRKKLGFLKAQASEENPEEKSRILCMLGQTLEYEGKYCERASDAADCFKLALESRPDTGLSQWYMDDETGTQRSLWLRCGNCLYSAARYAEAVALFRSALIFAEEEGSPAIALSPDTFGDQADSAERATQDGAAEGSSDMAAPLAPLHARVYVNLGVSLEALEDMREACFAYRNAIRVHPGYAMAHKQLGGAYMGVGRMRSAEAALTCAVTLQEDFVEAWADLGCARRWLGDHAPRDAGSSAGSYLPYGVAIGSARREVGARGMEGARIALARATELMPTQAKKGSIEIGAAVDALIGQASRVTNRRPRKSHSKAKPKGRGKGSGEPGEAGEEDEEDEEPEEDAALFTAAHKNGEDIVSKLPLPPALLRGLEDLRKLWGERPGAPQHGAPQWNRVLLKAVRRHRARKLNSKAMLEVLAHWNLAHAQRDSGEYAAAMVTFTRVLELQPTRWAAHVLKTAASSSGGFQVVLQLDDARLAVAREKEKLTEEFLQAAAAAAEGTAPSEPRCPTPSASGVDAPGGPQWHSEDQSACGAKTPSVPVSSSDDGGKRVQPEAEVAPAGRCSEAEVPTGTPRAEEEELIFEISPEESTAVEDCKSQAPLAADDLGESTAEEEGREGKGRLFGWRPAKLSFTPKADAARGGIKGGQRRNDKRYSKLGSQACSEEAPTPGAMHTSGDGVWTPGSGERMPAFASPAALKEMEGVTPLASSSPTGFLRREWRNLTSGTASPRSTHSGGAFSASPSSPSPLSNFIRGRYTAVSTDTPSGKPAMSSLQSADTPDTLKSGSFSSSFSSRLAQTGQRIFQRRSSNENQDNVNMRRSSIPKVTQKLSEGLLASDEK
eukprot:gene2722-3497_t